MAQMLPWATAKHVEYSLQMLDVTLSMNER